MLAVFLCFFCIWGKSSLLQPQNTESLPVSAAYGEPMKAPEKFLRNVEIPKWISQEYIEIGENARKGTLLEEINGVVIHYVANSNTTAEQNRHYFNNSGTEVNAHFVVGLEGEVIACVPLWEQSVASNDRNRDTFSIEVCHPDADGKFTQKTYDSLVRLTAWLCSVCDLTEQDVIRHYDITGKNCPKYFVENETAWEIFKKKCYGEFIR